MNIFRFSVGSEAKRVAVRCVFALGVVCWANLTPLKPSFFPQVILRVRRLALGGELGGPKKAAYAASLEFGSKQEIVGYIEIWKQYLMK